MLSAMFNQLPPNGVYNGRIPCDNSHATNASVLWPARLSNTNNTRNGGNSAGNATGLVKPCNHRSHACRAAAAVGGTAGNPASGVGGRVGKVATMADNSCRNQPCKTSLVQEVTP